MEPLKARMSLSPSVVSSHTSFSSLEDVKPTTVSSEVNPIASGSKEMHMNSVEKNEKAIEELNKAIQAIQGPQRTLEFSVHKDTHAVMIKVLNKDTGEIIREVPPEKLLDVAAKMMEFAGLIVDKKI
ncbi:flagellar protein FlaG [Paenibacillus silvae]|jgi:flagellar protein FlaG|uniref:flagellar protein FlaG n=1 Tax=Paenibacillus TaxID=44249 RepID=UPI0020A225FB|nr:MULTISPECIES: flagellar protein FlaG [Paenibacillus]MDM5281329.1 flagellar protein FlaG [Paenibacillus silvae]